MNWIDTVNTITSVAALLLAAYAFQKEGKRSRQSQGIDIIIRLSDSFNSDSFILVRKKVASRMESILKETLEGKVDQGYCMEKDQIIDLFQQIGSLTKARIINTEFAFDEFGYWCLHYWEFFKEDISFARREDPGVWAEASWLYSEFLKLKTKRNRTINAETMRAFIEYEKQL